LDAKPTGPAGGPQARTETVSGVTDSSRAGDFTSVETMELLQTRHNVRKAFDALPKGKQSKLLKNCSMKSIDDIDGIETAVELQQVRDAIVSV